MMTHESDYNYIVYRTSKLILLIRLTVVHNFKFIVPMGASYKMLLFAIRCYYSLIINQHCKFATMCDYSIVVFEAGGLRLGKLARIYPTNIY